jgi:molecular chaperone IbpA
MNTLTKFDLTPFHRGTIGFDRIFDILDRQSANTVSNTYPPYNIKQSGDTFQIEIAVAGFREDELDIEVKDNILSVTGEQKRDEETIYLHKGISGRDFIRTFTLGEYVEVKSATFINGLLAIDIKRELPEEAKPKKIAITSQTE